VTEETWAPSASSREDLAELVELCAAALPDETLSLDDLDGVLHAGLGAGSSDDAIVRCVDTAVLVVRGAEHTLVGAAAVSVTEVLGMRSAHLQLLVVHPSRRRRGIARSLVGAAEAWALERDVDALTVGAGAPFYLFTGVDVRWTAALCCFEALGYERSATELDLACPTVARRGARSVRSGGPVTLAHVADDQMADALVGWVREAYPHWQAELARAAEAGTVVIARDDATGAVVGAAAHSVSRFGVVGPVAVDPARHGSGIGSLLMDAVLADLSTAGLRTAEIAWTSTVRFYARACDARVGRASVVLRRELAPRAVAFGP
jgi:GNAT superfamily N-acetyltransferase